MFTCHSFLFSPISKLASHSKDRSRTAASRNGGSWLSISHNLLVVVSFKTTIWCTWTSLDDKVQYIDLSPKHYKTLTVEKTIFNYLAFHEKLCSFDIRLYHLLNMPYNKVYIGTEGSNSLLNENISLFPSSQVFSVIKLCLWQTLIILGPQT